MYAGRSEAVGQCCPTVEGHCWTQRLSQVNQYRYRYCLLAKILVCTKCSLFCSHSVEVEAQKSRVQSNSIVNKGTALIRKCVNWNWEMQRVFCIKFYDFLCRKHKLLVYSRYVFNEASWRWNFVPPPPSFACLCSSFRPFFMTLSLYWQCKCYIGQVICWVTAERVHKHSYLSLHSSQ